MSNTKYFTVFGKESFQEAISNHSTGYDSEEAAVQDTIDNGSEGDEFLVITDKLSILSRYIIKGKYAERVTDGGKGTAEVRTEAHDITEREMLFELVTALRNQNGGISISVRMKLRKAEKMLGLVTDGQ